MLAPLLLTLPLGILGLAMPPKETASPTQLQPRDAPPQVEVMTMTCLMPGGEETTSGLDTPPDWSSTTYWGGPDYPSSSSSSDEGDCELWGDCPFSTSFAPEPSSSSAFEPNPFESSIWSPSSSTYTCDDGWDCPTTSFSGDTSSSAFVPEESSTTFCDEWDPACSLHPTSGYWPTPSTSTVHYSTSSSPVCEWPVFDGCPEIESSSSAAAASSSSDIWVSSGTLTGSAGEPRTTTISGRHRRSSSSSSSSSPQATTEDGPVTTAAPHHLPLPPMIGHQARKRGGAPPPPPAHRAPVVPRAGAAGLDLHKKPTTLSERIRNIRAVEKVSTETIVIGVSTDGTPLYTSTEWGSDDSSSSSSSSSLSSSSSGSTSFFSEATTTTPHTSTTSTSNTDIVTPAPQWVTVSASGSSGSSTSIRCDDEFCSDGSSWCMYWAGITSWDASRGPVPGEKATIIGTC